MTNLRKEAKGRECQVRIPHYCNRNPETSVLAHIRMAGITGMGMKSDDLFGAIACSDCHAIIDGQRPVPISPTEIWNAHLEGVIRTQKIWIREGFVAW